MAEQIDAVQIDAIIEQLKRLNQTLESFQLVEQLEHLNQTLESFQPPPMPLPMPLPAAPPTLYLSGRWHRRDGDGYGIVPRPGVHDADHPPRDLRPSD
jgi:hypothetical protein